MATSKHTPGPWTHRNGRIFQTDREVLTIANVARAGDGDFLPANGCLIAAAPDLLEALETVAGCFGAASVEGLEQALAETQDERLKDLVERRLMHALYAAQDAIAKTTSQEGGAL